MTRLIGPHNCPITTRLKEVCENARPGGAVRSQSSVMRYSDGGRGSTYRIVFRVTDIKTARLNQAADFCGVRGVTKPKLAKLIQLEVSISC